MTWLFPSLRDYKRSWLRGDLLAGVTVWAVLVPEALAYATIAGVSPVVGLYAAPGALLLYAALGSSRQLVTGPMAATAALSAATVADLVPAGDHGFAAFTAGLALTTGLIALAAGLLRLGFLASFISEPVLKGFIVGLALTIIVGQLPELFGVEKGKGNFFEQAWNLLDHLGETQAATLSVGIGSLVVIVALKRLAPAVPSALASVVLGIAAVKVLDLDVDIVGHVDSGLPSFGLPDIDWHEAGSLVAGGVGVMLVGFAEGLGAAKNYAARKHQEIDADRELLGLGGANVASALSSGMIANGSLSKTAVNASAGGRSQLSGLVVAVLTVVTLLALTGLFENLPEATLSAIVVAAVVELVDVRGILALYRTYTRQLGRQFGWVARPDFIAAIAALLGVTVLDTLPGLFIGITVSLLLLIYRASHPYVAVLGRTPGPDGHYRDVARHPDAATIEEVAVLRVESGLYFANADTVRARILAAARTPGTRAVVLDAETTPFIDVSAARMLVALDDELTAHGVHLLLARDMGQFRDVLSRVADDSRLTARFSTVDAAVRAGRRASRVEP